jgi:hypothetical protein
MIIPKSNDPLYWRCRADEAHAKADELSDPGAKASMLKLAETYDKMADHAASPIATIANFRTSSRR